MKWVCDGGRGEGVGGEVDEMSGRVEEGRMCSGGRIVVKEGGCGWEVKDMMRDVEEERV